MAKLISKVRINPLTVDIDGAVDIDNISSDGVVIGLDAESVAVGLSSQPECILGDEAPMTIRTASLAQGSSSGRVRPGRCFP